MAEAADDVQAAKRDIRRQARAARREQPDKERLSREICGKLTALPQYAAAGVVMCYVDVRSEVRTRGLFTAAWEQGKRIVVPYCVGRRLELFYLKTMDELAVGGFGILEPKAELRELDQRKVEVSQLDLVVVPGVAFDGRGGRLGHGRGYYDGLLGQVRGDTALIALAFGCQLFPAVPMQPHDVYVHKVITETAIYPAQSSPRKKKDPDLC